MIAVPADDELKTLTAQALFDMRYPMLAQAASPARPGEPARPVPERVGEPSVFHHVVYLIKENRTYTTARRGGGFACSFFRCHTT